MLKLIFSIALLSLISCSSAPKLGKATGTGEMVTGPIKIVKAFAYVAPKTIPKKIPRMSTRIFSMCLP